MPTDPPAAAAPGGAPATAGAGGSPPAAPGGATVPSWSQEAFESAFAEAEVQVGRFNLAVFGKTGVGKSTLVNRLVPDADRAIGTVSGVGKGRHTSTQSVALALPEGGWLIDTPGVRSFGLAHVDPDRVLHAFPEFDPALDECPRGCPHTEGAQDCALDEYAASGAAGEAGPARLASLRRLLATRPAEPGA